MVDVGGAQAQISKLQEEVEQLTTEKGEMQLIAGRYQYLVEESMKAIRKVNVSGNLDALDDYVRMVSTIRKSPTEKKGGV